MPQVPGISHSLKVVNSNDLEVLAAVCADLIRKHPLSSALSQDLVLVMNNGMQTYLNQEIALRNKISSGICYEQIWVFIWDLYKKIFADGDKLNRFSRDSIAWSLLGLKNIWLGKEDFGDDPELNLKIKEILKPLEQYVADEDGSGTKSWELCHRIADTFDQYQMNRPEWIRLWNNLKAEDFKDPEHGAVFKVLKSMTPRRLRSENAQIAPQVKGNLWQPLLWTLLRANLITPDSFEKDESLSLATMDRVQIMDRLCASLSDDAFCFLHIKDFPERLFIMGVSSMPSQVIDFFRILGSRTEVYLMLINPCSEYWGDINVGRKSLTAVNDRLQSLRENVELMQRRSSTYAKAAGKETQGFNFGKIDEDRAKRYGDEGELEDGNALLTGFGRQGRDILSQLITGHDEHDEASIPDFINCFVKSSEKDVLSVIKNQLLTLDPPKDKTLIQPDDDSILFCSCHTRKREIEVLRDTILQKFKQAQQRGEKLLPKDILVMTPNIESYAAEIEAVFGNVDRNSVNYIPYSVGDRSVGNQDPVSEAVLKLMDIGTTPVTLSFVSQLLQVQTVASSFGFSGEDALTVTKWCQESNVRWGLDEHEALDEAGVGDLPWTFEKGLSRMTEGFMTGDLDENEELYTKIEGSDADLLGRFSLFVNTLIDLRKLFKRYSASDLHLEKRELDDEASPPMLLQLGEFFRRFVKDEDSRSQSTEFVKTLGGLVKILRYLKHKPAITLPTLRAILTKAFSNKLDETAYLRGRVNFCSLMPMRAVPFKHIFILGLNDGEFPRKEHAPGFNLLTLKAFFRRGDRSRSIDDRYLFLEGLLSAQKSITFSFIGASAVDGTAKNPSAVIQELWDYLDDNFKTPDDRVKPRSRLTYKARLNSYDPSNYLPEEKDGSVKRLPSFDEKCCIGEVQTCKEIGSAKFSVATGCKLPANLLVSSQDLISFFADPAKAFLRYNGIACHRDDEDLNDIEDFALNSPLDKGELKQKLLNAESDEKVSSMLESLKRSGKIPYGVFGEHTVSEFLQESCKLKKQIKSYLAAEHFAENAFNDPSSYDFSLTLSAKDLGFAFDTKITFVAKALFPLCIGEFWNDKIISPKRLYALALGALCQALVPETQRPPKRCAAIFSAERSGSFEPFTHDEALEALKIFMKWYLLGLTRPLPLWKGAVTAYLANAKKDKSQEEMQLADVGDFDHEEDARFIFKKYENLLDENGSLKELWLNFGEECFKPFVKAHCPWLNA